MSIKTMRIITTREDGSDKQEESVTMFEDTNPQEYVDHINDKGWSLGRAKRVLLSARQEPLNFRCCR